jgi:MFS family permease
MREDELYKVERDPRKRAGAAIMEGLRYAWGNSDIRLALTVLAIASTVGFNFHVIIPVLARDTLDAGPEIFGILSAFFGGGALLGALIQAARSKASWKGLLLGATGFSAGLLALSPVTTVWIACAILFAVGVCFTLWVSNTSAILQLQAPDRLRGRVMSLFMFAFAGLAPIGGLFAGWLMDVGGTELALSVGGAISLVVVALAWVKHTGVSLRPRRAEPLLVEAGERSA